MGPQEPIGHNTYASRPMKIVTITTVPKLSSRFQPVPFATCNTFNRAGGVYVPTYPVFKAGGSMMANYLDPGAELPASRDHPALLVRAPRHSGVEYICP